MIFQDPPFGYFEFPIRSIIPVAMDTKAHYDRVRRPDGYRALLLLESFTMDTAVHQIGALNLAFNKPTLRSHCAEVEVSCMTW